MNLLKRLFRNRRAEEQTVLLHEAWVKNGDLRRENTELRFKIDSVEANRVAGLRKQNDEQADMIRRLREESTKLHGWLEEASQRRPWA